MANARGKKPAGKLFPFPSGKHFFSPEEELEIGRRWLRGESVNSIAKGYDCDRKTLYALINNRLRPLWREMAKQPLDEIMAEVNELRRVAWKGFQDTFAGQTEETVAEVLAESAKGRKISLGIVKKVTRRLPNNTATAWLAVIQWCLEFEAKIHGYFAPPNSRSNSSEEFRVAGASPDQINMEYLKKLDSVVKMNREREKQLREMGLGSN